MLTCHSYGKYNIFLKGKIWKIYKNEESKSLQLICTLQHHIPFQLFKAIATARSSEGVNITKSLESFEKAGKTTKK